VYWSDIGRHKISYGQCLRGSSCDAKDLVADLIDTVDGIAVDHANQVLYWTDAGRQLIEVMKIPSGPRSVIVWNNLDSPRAIAVHSDSG